MHTHLLASAIVMGNYFHRSFIFFSLLIACGHFIYNFNEKYNFNEMLGTNKFLTPYILGRVLSVAFQVYTCCYS